MKYIWDKVFKNAPTKICGRQPLKNLKGYGLLKQTIFYFNWDSLHARPEQPLQGMELQEKETQKDQGIQEICLEKTYS